MPVKKYLIKIVLSILLVIVCAPIIKGQTAVFAGKIFDGESKIELAFATIALNSNGTITNEKGEFALTVNPGKYLLTIKFLGYRTFQDSISIASNFKKDFPLERISTLLETATITSSRFEQELGRVTVTTEVIPPRLIEQTNATSVEQALDKVPGVNIIDGQANIRGGSGYSRGIGSRVALLVDDIPILRADAGIPNWDFIPIENVERIEVVKGAGSVLYGTAAMNGVINVKTAFPTAQPYTKVTTFAGVYGGPKDSRKKWWGKETPFLTGSSMAHRQKVGRLDVVLGSYAFAENGFREGTFSRRGRVNANLRYRITPNLNVGLNTNVQTGHQVSHLFWANIDSGGYQAIPEALITEQQFRITVDPYLTFIDGWRGVHKLRGRYYDVENDNGNFQSNSTQARFTEYQYSIQLPIWETNLTGGAVAQWADAKSDFYRDTVFKSNNQAAYLQLSSSPFPRLTMNVGARYERNEIITPDSSTNDAQPVFKAGVNYRIAAFTYLRASYGEAYRFPTIAEKYISNTAGAIKFFPNPFLFPENGWGVELGVKQGFSIGALKGLFDFSVFWNEYSDMMEIVFGCQGPNCKSLFEGPLNSLGFATINIGDTRIKGLEGSLLLSGKIGNVNLNVLTGYTYIDPRFLDNIELQTRFSSSDKNLLKYRFRHVYKGDLEARYQGFFLGTDVFYNSFMEAIDVAFSDGLPDLKKYRAKHDFGDWVFGGRLGYQAESGSRFSFIVKNLLNEEYTVRPALFEAPRNYTVKVEWVIK